MDKINGQLTAIKVPKKLTRPLGFAACLSKNYSPQKPSISVPQGNLKVYAPQT